MRQREDDMMVADRKQFVLTRCEPLVAGVRQNFGQCRFRHELYEMAR